jgi:hypothetical protein
MNDQKPTGALPIDEEHRTERDDSPAPQTEHACEMCGRFDAVQIGDRFLCVDCYEGCGSCCQESTMND